MTEDTADAKGESATYSSYLSLQKLLAAQNPRSHQPSGAPEHDELLFIIIHQVFELWFKQLLHELDYFCIQIRAGKAAISADVLKRALKIVKVMVSQIDVLETMTPLQFRTFRDRLEQASGLQSVQFREIEFLLGVRRTDVLDRLGEAEKARLRARLNAPSLWDAFLEHLANRGYEIPVSARESGRDLTVRAPVSEEVILQLVEVYRGDDETSHLCELLTDLDEGLQEWRYRHMKMVERTIGVKVGTGGSTGVDFLKSTLNQPVFPELWEVRARL